MIEILAEERMSDIDEALFLIRRKISAFPAEYEGNEEELEYWRQVHEYVKELQDVTSALLEAGKTLFDAVKFSGNHTCPHGNGTKYPTHAWFCDECWQALEAAIAKAEGGVT